MSLYQFLRIVRKHFRWLATIPFLVAVLTYLAISSGGSKYYTEAQIYTGIASGYSIETGASQRVDYFAVKNALDNLLSVIHSRKTQQEVAIWLLAEDLHLKEPDTRSLSPYYFEKLQEIVPASVRELVCDSVEETVKAIEQQMLSADTGFFASLMTNEQLPYSYQSLATIQIKQLGSSDVLKMSYSHDDPAVAQRTLKHSIRIFVREYIKIKEVETKTVVDYFIRELEKASQKLSDYEAKMVNFNIENKIINYNEQTKFIAEQKKITDLAWQKEMMNTASGKATVEMLEKRFDGGGERVLSSKNILKLRNKLAFITDKIAVLEVKKLFRDSLSKVEVKSMIQLRIQEDITQKKLREEVASLYQMNNTKEGISYKELVSSWLERLVFYYESRAKFKVLEELSNRYKALYRQFAPLGATLKSIERGIMVAEKTYLELLHSLSLAKLKQQNIELASGIKILDEPYFPLEAAPSKIGLLTAASFLGSFIFILAGLLLLYHFDNSLRNIPRTEEKTGLSVITTFPSVRKFSKQSNFHHIVSYSMNLALQNIRKKCHNKTPDDPLIILISSMMGGEGKSFVSHYLCNLLGRLGEPTLYLQPEQKSKEDCIHFLTTVPPVEKRKSPVVKPSDWKEGRTYQEQDYTCDLSYMQATHPQEFSMKKSPDISSFRYVVVEIPALSEVPYSLELLKKADIHFLIACANRLWTKGDQRIVQHICDFMPHSIDIILNGIDTVIEENITEVPKKRSRLVN